MECTPPLTPCYAKSNSYIILQSNTTYTTIVLPVVSCKCETLPLTLREEHGLRVFENRVLRRIFWLETDDVIGEWRRLNSEEHNYLYSSPNIFRLIRSRRMRWARHVARLGVEERCIQDFRGEPEGKMGLYIYRYI
jgi:hypothetical protein